jgi:S1-C subfamily serine protease
MPTRRRIATMAVVLLPAGALAGPPAGDEAAVRDAVVKVYATQQVPNYTEPWSRGTTESVTGSGCLIEGRRVLTNAHVVSDSTFVTLRRNGDAEKYEARVVHVSHEADLALLAVEDDAFWASARPLTLGALPPLQREVLVYGFPEGGDTLSVTRGVVSRVEHQYYLHGGRDLLAGQIDAAVNPGNSGGPVTHDGLLVGVAMQTALDAESIGYMVPAPVIRHFLEDVADGRYDGFPSLGIDWQPVENRDLRQLYGVPPGRGGVLVTRVSPDSAAKAVLRRGDVLTSLGGQAIGADGTVEFRPRERTSLAFLVDSRQVGEQLPLEVLRDGEALAFSVGLGAGGANLNVVGPARYDRPPSYYVFAGLVFSPLTLNYLESWGEDWALDAPTQLLAELERPATLAGEEIVILVQVLAAAVSEGYHELAEEIVSSVDGVRPRNLAHFVELVEQGEGAFLKIGYRNDAREIVMRRDRARAASRGILARYGIGADRSPDLQPGTRAAAGAAPPSPEPR